MEPSSKHPLHTSELSASVAETEASISTPLDENLPEISTSDTEKIFGAVAEKADAIRRACDLRDFDALVQYATSEGGLLQDELRRLAWPFLLQCDRDKEGVSSTAWGDMPPHADEDQVQLDVNRSFVYYPEGTDEELSTKKKELSDLITQLMRRYPMLCYFQGYHDIAQVLLLVLGEEEAAPALVQVSLFRIRDYMLPSLTPALKHLQLIPAIIERADPRLRQHLSGIRPFFALAATLTLYAHDIQEYSDIARLFDFLLAHEPVVSIYLFAAIIVSRKKELLEIPEDEPEMLHFTLSKLPNALDLEGLISRTLQLFKDYPPESLSGGVWKRIPYCSVLKTSRDIFDEQSVEEAVELFGQQTRQLRNEELGQKALAVLRKHRKTIGTAALALLVAAVSFWMRKKGIDTSIWSYVNRFRS